MSLARLGAVLADLGDLALVPIGFAVLTWVAALIALRFVSGRIDIPVATLAFAFAFAVLGGVAGVITGSSMEALVGGLVTGVLGIVSAVLSYAFAKESDPALRAVIPFAIVLLLLNALAGLSVGQNWKKKWITYSGMMEEHRIDYKEIWVPATREYQKKILERCFAEHPTLRESASECAVGKLFPN